MSVCSICLHLAKSHILKSSPKYTSIFDASRLILMFTNFTYFPQDVSEMHTSFHPTELQLIMRSEGKRFQNLFRQFLSTAVPVTADAIGPV